MEKSDLLNYLIFAEKYNCPLRISGVSGKVSTIFVDSHSDVTLQGRFCSSDKAMSYKYENIVSCCLKAPEDQKAFEEEQQGRLFYGSDAEDIKQQFDHYKNYYQEIIRGRKDDIDPDGAENSPINSKASLKQQSIDRFDIIFRQAYLSPDSLFTKYLLAKPINRIDPIDDQPVILLSRSNFSQKQAIECALKEQVSVIEGPPGTGKTTTILSIIANLLIRGKHIVVVSKNNSAIENIKEELDKLGLPPFYLRLGNKDIMQKEVNPNLKALTHQALSRAKELPEENTHQEPLLPLYTRLKAMEADINKLIEKKNRLQENENMLRHIEKRREAFQEDREFYGLRKFENRTLEYMRREINRIAHSLQQLDYKGRYSILDRIKNSLIWKLNKEEFESEGVLLQFQLEYLYLVREIHTLSAELKYSKIEEKQQELARIYDSEYIRLSKQSLQKFLTHFFDDSEYQKAAQKICDCCENNIYKACKQDIRCIYPVILTTADALVYNYYDLIDSAQKIDCIIMDEASQCDLITGIPVLHLAECCVVVGDQKQLSAITNEDSGMLPKVKDAYNYFEESFLSSIQKVWPLQPTLLREHYRCDYSIINYCNKFFYNGELVIYTQAHSDAMQVLNVGQGKYAKASFCNEREIRAIEGLTGPVLKETYVITPFKNQGEELRAHFQCGKDTCGTIHTFQGRGQDNVFFSTVLNDLDFANSHLSGSHCLFQKELINVAVSRAKKHFILVSDTAYLRKKNKEMRNLIDYIESYGKEIPDTTVCLFDGLYQKMKAYTKHDNLDNIFEETVYNAIMAYHEKHPQFYCFIKFPLANLVTDKIYLTENPDIRDFVMHHNTHVDFTLCNAVCKPILAIELDGQHHNKPEQKIRDEKKDRALRHMQIPLWRLSSKAALTKDEFEQKISSFLE